MRKPLVASGGGFEAPSVKPVGDGGSAAQGLPARGVKATLGEGCGAKRVLVRVRGQGEPKPGSRGAGVVCRRPATAEQRRARRLSAGALCPGRRSGLRAKTTSLKGRGGLGDAHRGVMWPELRRSEIVGEVRQQKGAELADRCVELLRGRWRGQRGSGRSGDCRWQGISAAQRVTCDGVTGKIRHGRGPGLEMVASGSLLGPRRSRCDAWPGSGAAGR